MVPGSWRTYSVGTARVHDYVATDCPTLIALLLLTLPLLPGTNSASYRTALLLLIQVLLRRAMPLLLLLPLCCTCRRVANLVVRVVEAGRVVLMADARRDGRLVAVATCVADTSAARDARVAERRTRWECGSIFLACLMVMLPLPFLGLLLASTPSPSTLLVALRREWTSGSNKNGVKAMTMAAGINIVPVPSQAPIVPIPNQS